MWNIISLILPLVGLYQFYFGDYNLSLFFAGACTIFFVIRNIFAGGGNSPVTLIVAAIIGAIFVAPVFRMSTVLGVSLTVLWEELIISSIELLYEKVQREMYGVVTIRKLTLRTFKKKYPGWFRFNIIVLVWTILVYAQGYLEYAELIIVESPYSKIYIKHITNGLFFRFLILIITGNVLIALFEKTGFKNFKYKFPKWFWTNLFAFLVLLNSILVDLGQSNFFLAINEYDLANRYQVQVLSSLQSTPSALLLLNVIIAPFAFFQNKKKKSNIDNELMIGKEEINVNLERIKQETNDLVSMKNEINRLEALQNIMVSVNEYMYNHSIDKDILLDIYIRYIQSLGIKIITINYVSHYIIYKNYKGSVYLMTCQKFDPVNYILGDEVVQAIKKFNIDMVFWFIPIIEQYGDEDLKLEGQIRIVEDVKPLVMLKGLNMLSHELQKNIDDIKAAWISYN